MAQSTYQWNWQVNSDEGTDKWQMHSVHWDPAVLHCTFICPNQFISKIYTNIGEVFNVFFFFFHWLF